MKTQGQLTINITRYFEGNIIWEEITGVAHDDQDDLDPELRGQLTMLGEWAGSISGHLGSPEVDRGLANLIRSAVTEGAGTITITIETHDGDRVKGKYDAKGS